MTKYLEFHAYVRHQKIKAQIFRGSNFIICVGFSNFWPRKKLFVETNKTDDEVLVDPRSRPTPPSSRKRSEHMEQTDPEERALDIFPAWWPDELQETRPWQGGQPGKNPMENRWYMIFIYMQTIRINHSCR